MTHFAVFSSLLTCLCPLVLEQLAALRSWPEGLIAPSTFQPAGNSATLSLRQLAVVRKQAAGETAPLSRSAISGANNLTHSGKKNCLCYLQHTSTQNASKLLFVAAQCFHGCTSSAVSSCSSSSCCCQHDAWHDMFFLFFFFTLFSPATKYLTPVREKLLWDFVSGLLWRRWCNNKQVFSRPMAGQLGACCPAHRLRLQSGVNNGRTQLVVGCRLVQMETVNQCYTNTLWQFRTSITDFFSLGSQGTSACSTALKIAPCVILMTSTGFTDAANILSACCISSAGIGQKPSHVCGWSAGTSRIRIEGKTNIFWRLICDSLVDSDRFNEVWNDALTDAYQIPPECIWQAWRLEEMVFSTRWRKSRSPHNHVPSKGHNDKRQQRNADCG